MKKVFLIGKFHPLFEETNKYFSNYFSVQICVDNLMMMKSLIQLGKPDIFIFDQTEPSPEKDKILGELRKDFPDYPLLCLDNASSPTSFEDVMGIKNFRILTMPVSNEDVLVTACDLLDLEFNRESKTVGEKSKVVRNGRPCVLAVDDVAFQLRALNEVLKDEYDVMIATSAAKALTMIAKRIPDIILLDYEMPICDGKQTMQMIREIYEAKDVPIVFLTAHADIDHIKSVLDLKPAGYLVKPVKGDVLKAEIRKHLK
ncbi:MAG: response regulator [Oscillospiraceae bacterium]|nr:response regulator [Oscillospiraceae bacterium]